VIFKGEEDPTSIPGNWFSANATFFKFQILDYCMLNHYHQLSGIVFV
jgi:hypothetical protein